MGKAETYEAVGAEINLPLLKMSCMTIPVNLLGLWYPPHFPEVASSCVIYQLSLPGETLSQVTHIPPL